MTYSPKYAVINSDGHYVARQGLRRWHQQHHRGWCMLFDDERSAQVEQRRDETVIVMVPGYVPAQG